MLGMSIELHKNTQQFATIVLSDGGSTQENSRPVNPSKIDPLMIMGTEFASSFLIHDRSNSLLF